MSRGIRRDIILQKDPIVMDNSLESIFKRPQRVGIVTDIVIPSASVNIQNVDPFVPLDADDLPAVFFLYGDTQNRNSNITEIGDVREVFNIIILAQVNKTNDQNLIDRSDAMEAYIDDIVQYLRFNPNTDTVFMENVVKASARILRPTTKPTSVQFMQFDINFLFSRDPSL